ncbi:MAG: acyl-CoA reductase [Flavisolibacter sp.]
MDLKRKTELLVRLGKFLTGGEKELEEIKAKSYAENQWFVPEFIDISLKNISNNYLHPGQLQYLINRYKIPENNSHPKTIGIVMAGNIPLVGFHDLLCVFITGNMARIKLSSKDEALPKYILNKLMEWEPDMINYVSINDRIPKCEAYIATGSNNSARYFDYYFKKYPSIIRKSRTSVAVLNGKETNEQLELLADDVYQYFGLGCRNITKLFVPEGYDFIPLLEAFKKYNYLINHNKFKNNYDYNLAIHILNNHYYMTNGSLLLIEDKNSFSPIGQLNYEYYSNDKEVIEKLSTDETIQYVITHNESNFGKAQNPGICDFADRADTMQFLISLS